MTARAALRDTMGFLRWRLIPVRKLGKLKGWLSGQKAPGGNLDVVGLGSGRLTEMDNWGWTVAPSPDASTLREIAEIYEERVDDVAPTDSGHPFENIVHTEDFDARNPLFQFALSDKVLGAAECYFGGSFSIASIQVLRSFPTEGDLRESQKWHRDFGDSKSLHFIMYLSAVTAPEHGPFAFYNKQVSKRVRRSPIIRRLSDAQIASEIGPSDHETFYGRPGDAIFVDPAVCYHCGSRCRVPRTAVFITFNTHRPYTPMMEPLGSHRFKAAAEAKIVRPDLPPDYIDRVFQI